MSDEEFKKLIPDASDTYIAFDKNQIVGGSNKSTPIETLNTAAKVAVKAPKGATMVRVTDSAGRTAIQDLKSVQGDNVFKDAGIKKIEAGTIGKDKKFIPIKGEVEVEPKLVGMGGALEGEVSTGAGADITGIAQRVREQVAKAGQEGLPPRGEGINAEDSVERGEEMLKQGADPEKAMADFEASPEKRFGASDMALVRAQLRRLAFEARRTEEQHGTESPEFLKAWQARTDWAARVKKMQTQWHAAGEAQQGEQDIDTGSFSGLATAFKDDTGRDFTEPQRKAAKRIAAGVNEADKAAAKAAADLNQHLFDFLKDVPVKVPDTVGQAQRVFAEFSKGHRLANIIGPMSQHQIKFIWGFAKKYYTDRGETNFEKIFQGVANDLGLDVKDVRRALARNSNGQKILHDAYVKQYRARQLKNSAKLWVKSQADPTWWRRIKSIPRAQFNLTVTGHATTWIGTHAGQNLFDPTRWGTLGRNYHKMWRVAFSEANWEAEAADLTKRPNWGIARRAGVNNDPYVRQGDYDSPEMTKFFAKLGAGKKGALGLLTLRQDFFDQAWDKLPQSNRTDEAAKLIANDVNHSTGTTRMQAVERPLTSFLMFAPRLVAARWQWELYDPAKAIITKAFKNSTATPAEHMFANMILKRRAIFAATYISALGLNSILLDATGSNQKLNLTDPHKSDWLGFKGFGMEARPFSAGIAIMRLLAAEYKDLFITPQKPKPWEEPRAQSAGDITQYLQQTASPTASTLADLISQTDMFGNPLPPQPGRDIKNPPPKQPKWQEREGRAPYTWPSYAAQRFSPIPFEAAIREAFQSQGMPADKAANWTRIILGSAAMATTGVLVEKDPNLNK